MSAILSKNREELDPKSLAKDFLEGNFGPQQFKGHVLLKRAAVASFETFVAAFDFAYKDLQAAKGFGNLNAQFDYLINVWYGHGATLQQLIDALTRWEHLQLLHEFGLKKN